MATYDSVVRKTPEKQSPFRFRRPALKARSATSPHSPASPQPHALRGRARAQSYPERDGLAVKLLPLVKRVAFELREHLPQHVEVDDLTGAGILGLLDAVRKFDARKHVKIETYARHRIRGAILDSLREMDTASRDMRKKNKHAEKVYHELEAKLGRSVTDDEMAQALGMSLKKWYRTVQELNSVGIEWMRPNQIPEVAMTDESALPADDRENPFNLCYRQEQREILARAMAQLSERERTVVSLYYKREMTMKQIGDQIGVDESRVSQIHSAALLRLRAKVRKALQPRPASVPPAFMVAEISTSRPFTAY
jgi:RNA polymerase sigma factor for flagellar operon FliA